MGKEMGFFTLKEGSEGWGRRIFLVVVFFSLFSTPSYSEDLQTALLRSVAPLSDSLDNFTLAMRGRILRVVANMSTGREPILSANWAERFETYLDSGGLRPLRSNAAYLHLRRAGAQNQINIELPPAYFGNWKCEREETGIAHEILHVVQTENHEVGKQPLENVTWVEPLESAASLAEVRYFSNTCVEPSTDTELASLAATYQANQTDRLHRLLQARVPNRALAGKLTALSLTDGHVVLQNFQTIIALMNHTLEMASRARTRAQEVETFQEIRAFQRYLPTRIDSYLETGIRSRADLEEQGLMKAGGVDAIQSDLRPKYNEAVRGIWKTRKDLWDKIDSSI